MEALKEEEEFIMKRMKSECLRPGTEILKEKEPMIMKKPIESERWKHALNKDQDSMIMKKSIGFESQQSVPKEFFHLPVKRSSEADEMAILKKDRGEGNNSMNSSVRFMNSVKKGNEHLKMTQQSGTKNVCEPCKISDGRGAFKPFNGYSTSLPATAGTKDKGKQVMDGPSQRLPPPVTQAPRTKPGFEDLIWMTGPSGTSSWMLGPLSKPY